MTMPVVRGQALRDHPLSTLTKTADLVLFDGPILGLSENPSGEPYLHLWCDVDGHVNRWVVFRVSREQLTRYVDRRVTLRNLVLDPPDGFLYLADMTDDLSFEGVQIVQPSDLPDSYRPSQDSLYKFEPINTEVSLNELSRRYGTPILNVHLRHGQGVSYGSANAVTLGRMLEATGTLAESVAISLYARGKGPNALSPDEARAYGAFEYLTAKAASFSAILRPVAQQQSFPGFQDRTTEVVKVMMQLLEQTTDLEGLKEVARRFPDSVLRGLEHFANQVTAVATAVDLQWVGPDSPGELSAGMDPSRSSRIIENINHMEREEAEGFWNTGYFLALDLKLRSYRFSSTAGRESVGHFDSKIAYPLTHLSFEEEYHVYMSRRIQKREGRRRRVINEVIAEMRTAREVGALEMPNA